MRLDSINSWLILALLSLFMFGSSTHAANTLKIATVAPEGSQWMQDMRIAAKEIGQRTDERVKIKFYGGGVMGNDKKVLRKIRIGQLQGGVFTANGLAERYRDIVLYGLPMVFRSQDEADYVRERMDPILAAGLDAHICSAHNFTFEGRSVRNGNRDLADRNLDAANFNALLNELFGPLEVICTFNLVEWH